MGENLNRNMRKNETSGGKSVSPLNFNFSFRTENTFLHHDSNLFCEKKEGYNRTRKGATVLSQL